MTIIKKIIQFIINCIIDGIFKQFESDKHKIARIGKPYIDLKEKLQKIDDAIKKALIEEDDDAIAILMIERERIIQKMNNL